jgi:flagellin
MTSTGSGQIFAANASGQGSSAILDDTAAVTGAATAAAGKATATTMDLTMDASDKVSFQISDGRTNAVVRLTQFDPANNAAMLAEINTALTNAGSDITVAAGPDTDTDTSTADEKLVLTNSKGGVINLTNFTSDSTGIMTTSPGANQGVGKMLTDDGVTGSQAAISSVDINTSAGATSAIGAIDRALEQVSSERSKLGAIANRIEHTIDSLTNVSTNMSEARGRIMDADFAAETTALSKAQILQQASTAMLAQANASKQNVLSLLQG